LHVYSPISVLTEIKELSRGCQVFYVEKEAVKIFVLEKIKEFTTKPKVGASRRHEEHEVFNALN